MALTRDLRIKVTPLQLEILKSKAQLAGKKSISAYIRDSLTKEQTSIEELVKEIHTMVVQEQKMQKR